MKLWGMRMQLFFGMAADGRTFPDHPGTGNGALDCAVVGPARLLDALEAQLGLLGPQVSTGIRRNDPTYQANRHALRPPGV